jgi:hypothetical protein
MWRQPSASSATTCLQGSAGAHIFVGSKAAWFEITDDLPQFNEYGG